MEKIINGDSIPSHHIIHEFCYQIGTNSMSELCSYERAKKEEYIFSDKKEKGEKKIKQIA